MLEIGFGLFLRPRSTEVLDFGPLFGPYLGVWRPWSWDWALPTQLGRGSPSPGVHRPKIRPCRVLVCSSLSMGDRSGTYSEKDQFRIHNQKLFGELSFPEISRPCFKVTSVWN